MANEDAWEKLNKASRKVQKNPSKKNQEELKNANRKYLEDQAKNTKQPEDRP